MNSKDKGDITQAKLELVLLTRGYTILNPRGDNQRYDLVIEKDGKFERVQCKTGRLRNGSVVFSSCSSSYHRNGKKQPYINQIEYFGVYCPDNDTCYLIPETEVNNKDACKLRIDEPKKSNSRFIWAKDYILV